MKKTNKECLSLEVANRLGTTQKDGRRITSVVFDCIREHLAEGRNVEVRGFGTWRTRKTKERKGRNPKTGDSLLLPSRTSIGFRAGRKLKVEVNNNK
jgi:nucleoid DNA-binding protein